MSPEPPAAMSLHYRLLLGTFRFLFRLLTRVDVRGLENIPTQGGVILASNHISALEGPLIFSLSRRHPLSALAKLEWKESPVGRFILDAMKPVYVARGEVDRQALKATVQRLKAGEAFGISPEGTRSRDARLAEGKEGLAYVAFQSGAAIVPVATWGQEKFGSEIKRFRRPQLHVRFGEPLKLESDPALNRRENLAAATERIMLEIARMLPTDYRGFYAEKAAQLPPPPGRPMDEGEVHDQFVQRYRAGNIPWDSGEVPSELRALVAGLSPGRALDLGCGTGLSVCTLAAMGWEATGVDFVPAAIASADARGCEGARFLVGDVSRLDALPIEGAFDLFFDRGCLHSLSDRQREGYASQVQRLAAPGAWLLLYAALPRPNPEDTPRGIGPDKLAALFAPRFTVERHAGGEQGGGGWSAAWYWLRAGGDGGDAGDAGENE